MNLNKQNILRKQFFNTKAKDWFNLCYFENNCYNNNRFHDQFLKMFSYIDLKPGYRVADIGCGSGILVPYILEKIGDGGILYENDYAEKMIEENKKKHNDARIVFLKEDVNELSIENDSIDCVICFSCFPHFNDKLQALKIFHNILKNNSSLYIVHFSSSNELNNFHKSAHSAVANDFLPSKDEMLNLIKSVNFEIQEFIDEPGFYFLKAKNSN